MRVGPEHVPRAPGAEKTPWGAPELSCQVAPPCTFLVTWGWRLRFGDQLGSCSLLSYWRVSKVFPKFTFPRGPCAAAVGHSCVLCPRPSKKRSDKGSKEQPAALSATLKARSSEDSLRSGCPCSSVERHLIFTARLGWARSWHRDVLAPSRQRQREKGWPGTDKAGERQGLEPGRSQEQELAEREVFQAPNLGSSSESRRLVSDTRPLGRKSGGRKCGPSPPTPLPQTQGRAVSTLVSAKEGECQIAPHPLVSDPQPRTLFLNLQLNPSLLSSYPQPRRFFF